MEPFLKATLLEWFVNGECVLFQDEIIPPLVDVHYAILIDQEIACGNNEITMMNKTHH